jgi:hypothetical protein
MIRKVVLLAGVFVIGVITGAVTLYLLAGRGTAMVYSSSLEAIADAALKVRLREQAGLQSMIVARAAHLKD